MDSESIPLLFPGRCDTTHGRRFSVVVGTPAWHAGDLGLIPGQGRLYFMCKNLALNIRDCASLCLSGETLKTLGPFYLVSTPGEVKYPTHGVNVQPVVDSTFYPIGNDNSLNNSC